MKFLGPVWSILIICALITWVNSLPTKDSTTRRIQYGDTIKEITSQLMSVNGTLADITFDTRTPPKVQQQMLKKHNIKKEHLSYENSHPGIAVPVNEEDVLLEEHDKKYNFYKTDKVTTDGGLSTWVLLNSHTVAPPVVSTKPAKKPTPKVEIKNVTSSETIKPAFKKRPTTTTTTTTTVEQPTTTTVKPTTIKQVEKNKNNNKSENRNKQKHNTTKSEAEIKQKVIKVSGHLADNPNELIPSPEAKVGELELNTTDASKKPKRPTNKKKKNKKRRPIKEKAGTDISSLVDTLTGTTTGKPIGTQIYNYLSREIIPTVGVGLVGLVVTAGLASYFLYPFGVARRSYEVDRKDKEGTYYYNDEYGPGALDEEEVIGKVIAGMPVNSKNYRSQSSKNIYSNIQYNKKANYDFNSIQNQPIQQPQIQPIQQQQIQPIQQQQIQPIQQQQIQPVQQPQATVEAVYLTPDQNYNDDFDTYVPHRSIQPSYYSSPQKSYNPDVIEYNQEKGYTVEDKKFVVGNTPKAIVEEVTPAVVPEHGPRLLPEEEEEEEQQGERKGSLEDLADIIPKSLSKSFLEHEPRSLKIRKRRSNDLDNEVLPEKESSTKTDEQSTETIPVDKPTFINTLKDLFELKIKLGLELLQNTTKAISRYLTEVQSRFNNMTHSEEKIKKE